MAHRVKVTSAEHAKPAEDDGAASSVRTFTERTTMHGCQSTMQADYHVIRRLMWVILMLVSTGLFLNAFISGIMKYRSYPSSISVDIQPNTNLTLPDVTVCNNNLFSQSFLDKQNPSTLAVISAMFGGATSMPGDDVTNTIGYSELFFNSMPPLDRFISQCRVNFESFDCKQYIHASLAWTGACYTLNMSRYTIAVEAPILGLRFEISLDESEYSTYTYSTGMGVKLMFHEHGEFPDDRWSVNLEPDTDVHVTVQKSQNIRLGTPYSKDDCHDGEGNYSLYSVYTQRGCQMECMDEYFRTEVGCDFVGNHGLRNCTVGDTNSHMLDADAYAREDCECLRSCIETIYTTGITTLAHRGIVPAQDDMKISVNVYYPTFDVKVVTQEPSYDFNSFIADVGGQMGLFLGASILTLSEMFEFIVVTTIKKLKST